MKKVFALLLVVALLSWAPWLTTQRIEEIVRVTTAPQQSDVVINYFLLGRLASFNSEQCDIAARNCRTLKETLFVPFWGSAPWTVSVSEKI